MAFGAIYGVVVLTSASDMVSFMLDHSTCMFSFVPRQICFLTFRATFFFQSHCTGFIHGPVVLPETVNLVAFDGFHHQDGLGPKR